MRKKTNKTSKKNKALALQTPKGMHDILPQDQVFWNRIKRQVKEIAEYYSFLRIDTPILERAELFERSLGETTDVVEKQMFVFKSKGKDRLVLRPEGTASIARAYIQHGLSHIAQPLKLYYEGPMFRYEQPQAGRFRQFHQAGFEMISHDDDPIYDAQVILACYRAIEGLKIKKLTIQINTIGCKNCRPAYRQKLQNYYKSRERHLCRDCRRRLTTNPLRLLDCQNKDCQDLKKDAPIMLDNLCGFCNSHFKAVLEYIEELKLPYNLNNHLVRGLDYYNRTVFEIFAEGFYSALAGGGRYDYLIELLGGRHSSAVGGAIGLERLIEVIKASNIIFPMKTKNKVFLIHIGNLAKKKSLTLIEELRNNNIDILESLGKDSLKAQLRSADKFKCPLALIFGQKEAFEESIIIRDLHYGTQETVPLKKMADVIKRKLK